MGTWRYEEKFGTTSQVSDKSADASGDFRMAVDVDKMASATCSLCQSTKKLRYTRATVYLRYEPAQNDGIFQGFLHVEAKDPMPWLLRNSFGLVTESQQLHHQAHVNFEILRASIKQIIKEPSGEAPRQRCKPLVHGLHLIDCIDEVVMPAPQDCSYLALSYVWGSPTNNEPCGVFPKLPGQLPRTIQDAIAVTKALGYRFLWVDRYCVDQVDAQIKHEQIRQMWNIYASAHLTIVAASGDGPDRGLPGVSLPRSHLLLEDAVLQVEGLSLIPQIFKTNEVRSSTWASRAWTFQENFASPRRLYFCESLAIYAEGGYCASDIGSPYELNFKVDGQDPGEIFGRSLASKKPHGRRFRGDHRIQARECVEAYCMRNLTYDSDALNGILGVLNHFSQDHISPTYHIWGVVVAPVVGVNSYKVERNSFEVEMNFYEAEMNSYKVGMNSSEVGMNSSESGIVSLKLEIVSYEVSIHWYHPEPGVRRKDFPSWSPIAWRGSVKYGDLPQSFPITPSDYTIHIYSEGSLQPFEAYVTSGQIQRDSGRPDAPRQLTFSHVRTLSINIEWDNSTLLAVLQIDSTTDVVLPVFWDKSVTKDDVSDLIGMVVTTCQHGGICIMLLKPIGTYYERIGLIIWDYQSRNHIVRDRRSGVHEFPRSVADVVVSPPLFASEVRRDIVLG